MACLEPHFCYQETQQERSGDSSHIPGNELLLVRTTREGKGVWEGEGVEMRESKVGEKKKQASDKTKRRKE